MSESFSSPSSSPPQTPPNLHQNTVDPSAKWLVQKFGGTSVGKFPAKIATEVVPNYIDQYKVAIVCSARSGCTKALGTTNLLLRAASEAVRRPNKRDTSGTPDTSKPGSPALGPRSRSGSSPRCPSPQPFTSYAELNGHADSKERVPDFVKTIYLLRDEHIAAARAAVQNPDILRELEAEIERDCDWLRHFLFAAKLIDEISPRSRDTIIGLGEKLGCKIMTAALLDQGIDAEYVSLEDVVPWSEEQESAFTGTLDQDFYDTLAQVIGERIQQCAPRVPVVTGYFGPVPGSLLHQVGRGYTDLLAALLAVGVQAAELQIWKEVDGIFTADPRKVPTARLLSIISPEEVAELTYYGSEVVHPFSMEQVIQRKIPIRIKNVENPAGGGTVIHPDPEVDSAEVQEGLGTGSVPEPAPLSLLRELSHRPNEREHKRVPTAVTIKEHIIVVNVNSNRKSVSHGFLAGIFSSLDRFGLVVDLISTSEVHVSMALEDRLSKKMLERLLNELRKNGSVSIHRDMAILSLVGKQMRNMVGIAGRMFTTLAQGNVNIEMISQGASEINISCVIKGRDAVKALNIIHHNCLQIKPEGAKGRVGPWLF
ncbi:hypothetical protein APHAL10511_002462 [Amanita phalloides]|nr:hypothetical protein APHAL10511_002462 [Amanita phalloides]